MMSQDILGSLHESGESINKGLKQACERVAENVQQNPETRDRFRALVCFNNMNNSVAGDGVHTTSHNKGDGEKDLQCYRSAGENDHLVNSSLAVPTFDSLSCSIVEVSCKLRMSSESSEVLLKMPLPTVSCHVSHNLPLSAASSDGNQSNDSQAGNVCSQDLSKLQEKKIVGSARERYLSMIEVENKSSSFTANSNYRRLESLRKNKLQNGKNSKINVYGDQSSSKVLNAHNESSPSQLSVNTRGNFKGKYLKPKQLSKTSEAPSIHATSSEGNTLFSGQTNLQKCRTSGSMSSVVLRCPSTNTHTPKPNPSLTDEILNPATVKSLKSKFGALDRRQECNTTPASCSSSVCSQTSHGMGTRVRIKPCSTIQRIQEQLLQKMDNDEVKFSSSKTMQKLVHKIDSEQHQESETNAKESSSKNSGVYADKLHKEEKPYRQWHRMSRVLTAESKFIISPMLPCQAVFHTRKNIPVPGKPVELVKIEDTIKKEEKQVGSVVSAPEDAITSVECTSCERETEMYENTNIHEAEVKIDSAETEVLLTDEGLKSEVEIRQEESCNGSPATPSPSISDNGVQNKNQIAVEETDDRENTTKKQIKQDTSLQEPRVNVRRIPIPVASMSLSRHKMLNLKTLHLMKHQSLHELNEVGTSNTRDRHDCPASTDVTDKIKPLNSVSGASQVTGPSFSEFKNDPFKPPSKKIVRCGPLLRTATRSRHRCNSPCSTNSPRGAESQSNQSNVSRHTARHSNETSRNVSSERRSDSVRRHEQRLSTQPRYTLTTRAQESDHNNPECINRNWSSRCPVVRETHKEPDVILKKPHKVLLADVASKLVRRVSRASLRGPWNESSQKYTEVKATKDYNGPLPGQLSFRKGQIIKQKSFVCEPSDGMCYGYYRVGRLRKKKKGLFPITCVATDDIEILDGVSLTSSAKSAM